MPTYIKTYLNAHSWTPFHMGAIKIPDGEIEESAVERTPQSNSDLLKFKDQWPNRVSINVQVKNFF